MQRAPIPTVDVHEAHRRLTSGGPEEPQPILVDVREVGEYLQARAEGAVLLPLSQWMVRYQELPRDRPLLMICQSGNRSGQATAFLLANGWSDVVNVADGTGTWIAAGLPARSGPLTPEEASSRF